MIVDDTRNGPDAHVSDSGDVADCCCAARATRCLFGTASGHDWMVAGRPSKARVFAAPLMNGQHHSQLTIALPCASMHMVEHMEPVQQEPVHGRRLHDGPISPTASVRT